MYIPRHFSIEEWVPEHIFTQRGERAWELLDERILRTADEMREVFGPMMINTWFSPKLIEAYGFRQWSGLRTAGFFQTKHGDVEGDKKYCDSLSQHKFGRAFDCVFRDHTAASVREAVRAMRPAQFPYLTAIETDISWFHGDCRNCEPLKEFAP